jgi:hypothetical protein
MSTPLSSIQPTHPTKHRPVFLSFSPTIYPPNLSPICESLPNSASTHRAAGGSRGLIPTLHYIGVSQRHALVILSNLVVPMHKEALAELPYRLMTPQLSLWENPVSR